MGEHMTTPTNIFYRRAILAGILAAFGLSRTRPALACGGGAVGSVRGPASTSAEPNFKKLLVGTVFFIGGAVVGTKVGIAVAIIGIGIVATMGVAEIQATFSQLISDIKSN